MKLSLRTPNLSAIAALFIILTSPGSGSVISYTYDSAGRLTRAEYGGGKDRNYQYDAAGNLMRVASAGGISVAATFNQSGQLVLSWPASAQSFVLESASSLSTPIVWTAVTFAPETEAGQRHVTIIPGGGTQFYRLRQP